MSIIVPSNHTRIGAWVNSKMSGRIPQGSSMGTIIKECCRKARGAQRQAG